MNNLFEQLAEITKPEDFPDYRYEYPELSQEGQKVTQDIVNRFSDQLKKSLNDILFEFTCNLGREIISEDSWLNLREKTRDALKGYPMKGEFERHDWVAMRAKILEENRDQIVSGIITDQEKEISRLNKAISYLQENRF